MNDEIVIDGVTYVKQQPVPAGDIIEARYGHGRFMRTGIVRLPHPNEWFLDATGEPMYNAIEGVEYELLIPQNLTTFMRSLPYRPAAQQGE